MSQRPQHGGAGYTLIGHHEIMSPLLYAMILETFEHIGESRLRKVTCHGGIAR